MWNVMFRNVMEIWPGRARPARPTGEFSGLLASCSCCVSLPGAGVREDVFLIWREMEEACRTLAQIQRVLATLPKFGMTTTEHGGCYLWSLGWSLV